MSAAITAFEDRIIATRVIPRREACLAALPDDLHPILRDALIERGLDPLFSHQEEMFRGAQDGRNMVITTGTASGKSLSYYLPVLQSVLNDDANRALFLFPTKALGQDQLRGLMELIGELEGVQITAGVYDGDTPPNERKKIRDKAHLILTNPDMINAGWLPNHGKSGFSHVFRNIRYIVVDEMHVYRGAFGSHFANVMRRLRRVCQHHGSNPQILCSSATIANPADLAARLFEQPFTHIARDGSPAAAKTIHFCQSTQRIGNVRRTVVEEMATLLPGLIAERKRTIAFCRSRKDTEVVLKEVRDALSSVDGGHDESSLIAAYRGGYTPNERREVANALVENRLIGVVSTNALELGVDIGGLEVVVQGGFPGTRASFWQQVGRAGRRESESLAFVLLAMTPLDQYIASDPDWVLRERAESAVVDPDNLMIQLAHVRAAAAELPLTLDDAATFPDLAEVVAVLEEAQEVRELYGAYHWQGGPHPAGDFSLRTVDDARFKIVEKTEGRTLTEMDRPQTYHEAHPRAVYLHDGQEYLVEHLDLTKRVATVTPVDQDFYTEPDVRTKIDVIREQTREVLGETSVSFGDVRVHEVTVGYKMLQFRNHQNLGYEALDEKLAIEMETEALWIPLPEKVLAVLGEVVVDAMRGMVHALQSRARMRVMAERSDLRGSSFHAPDSQSGRMRTALILHDTFPGGLGFASRASVCVGELLTEANSMLDSCWCENGCAGCVGDFRIRRDVVRWALQSLLKETAPPADLVRQSTDVALNHDAQSKIPFDALTNDWQSFSERALEAGFDGAGFLQVVSEVRIRNDRLTLSVNGTDLRSWSGGDVTNRRIEGLVSSMVDVPEGFHVRIEAIGDSSERRAVKDKLRRRFDDLLDEENTCP